MTTLTWVLVGIGAIVVIYLIVGFIWAIVTSSRETRSAIRSAGSSTPYTGEVGRKFSMHGLPYKVDEDGRVVEDMDG